MIKLTFLGTTSMVPTKQRNHSALLLRYGSEGLLFDCGEGTQRQLKLADLSLTSVTKILITHWHGDHVFGLPGLIQTLGTSNYQKTLEIYGPKGTKKRFKDLYKTFSFEANIKIKIFDVKKGKIFDNNYFSIYAEPLQHSIQCLGYKFIEKDIRKIDMAKAKRLGLKQGPLLGQLQKGKSISFKGKKISPNQVTFINKGKIIGFIADTVPCNGALKIARDTDLLICEANYASNLEEKGERYGHMTSKQAAQIASRANSKKLILTHFSQRYKDTGELLEDAKTIFPNTICAYDFLKVSI